MIQFIDEHRDRFTVEFICQTLKSNREGGFITSRGYRQSKARGLSARSLRDAALVEHISAVHSANYGVYGVRKIWHVLRRDGIDIGREQTARLMRLAGVTGKSAEADLDDLEQAVAVLQQHREYSAAHIGDHDGGERHFSRQAVHCGADIRVEHEDNIPLHQIVDLFDADKSGVHVGCKVELD